MLKASICIISDEGKLFNLNVSATLKRNRSLTKDEIDAYWKSKKKIEEESSWSKKQKKCAERSFDQTISEQYRIVTK